MTWNIRFFVWFVFLSSCVFQENRPLEELCSVYKFDGLEFERLNLDVFKGRESFIVQREEIYKIIEGGKEVYFIGDSDSRVFVGEQTLDSLSRVSDTLTGVLSHFVENLRNVDNKTAAVNSVLDRLNTEYLDKKLSFKAYDEKKRLFVDSIACIQKELKLYAEECLIKYEGSVLSAYILSTKISDSSLFSLENELEKYKSIYDRYLKLNYKSNAETNFLKYIKAYLGYSSERKGILERLEVGVVPENIILPNKRAGRDELYRTARESEYTLLIFVKNSCEVCKKERQALKLIYSKYARRKFQIFEVSLDENLTSMEWRNLLLSEYNYDWIQVKDTAYYDKSYGKKYNVISTPTNYLLKGMKIQKKDFNINDLSSILNR